MSPFELTSLSPNFFPEYMNQKSPLNSLVWTNYQLKSLKGPDSNLLTSGHTMLRISVYDWQ